MQRSITLGGMGLLAAMLLMFVPAFRAGVDPAVILFYLHHHRERSAL